MFYKKGVLTNFAKLTVKHLCWSLFLNEVPDLKRAALSIKRRRHRYFFVNWFNIILDCVSFKKTHKFIFNNNHRFFIGSEIKLIHQSDQSDQVFFSKNLFSIIFCSSNLSISSIDKLIGLKSGSSIFLNFFIFVSFLFFYPLSFDSLNFLSISKRQFL